MTEQMNFEVAARLDELGRILDSQGANQFRVRAYLNAARTIRGLNRSIAEIARAEGIEGLKKLVGVGDVLARSINQLVTTGRLPMLERLRSESDPVEMLASVPGIGRILAERLHDELGIDTLEELEAAAYDGRLIS
jgi:DNA polymerase/3'-5' exonuclease PolX